MCVLFCVQQSSGVKLVNGPSEPLHNLQFMSDGIFIYWLYALKAQETVPHPVTGERVKQHPVYLHTLELKVTRLKYITTTHVTGWKQESITVL